MKQTLLIVDDKKLLRETLFDFLSDKNYNLLEAETAKVALEIFKAQAVDLVLLDINLPDIDGLKALKFFKKIKPNVPIVGLTGELSIELRKSFLDYGGYDIETKSTIFERLIPVIESALSGKEANVKNFDNINYEAIADELEKSHRWEEVALYLKEGGLEQQAMGNMKKAKELFDKAIQNYRKAGRKSKADEIETIMESL